ncbi:MAG TPA: hypothetical protein VFB96_04420 [Pirellulaceae bacterium]|nr:hypothetical protein [Pirellulaceae bacterium]
MKQKVLESVQSVVVDEDINWTLCGEEMGGVLDDTCQASGTG